ncbi:MAG: NUDIX domain-containing protein [Candidatus Saccharibacteria bacterium]|nr:NUDIX domain-containing protein [Candidatus Saccharibacteria bacterium]
MPKQSAGIILYKNKPTGLEVLLVHPGGPFFARKNNGVWSVPKGEFEDEEPLQAAKREFAEELGYSAPEGEYIDLGFVKNKSGKTIFCFAIEGDFDPSHFKSNTFDLEWPPKSGEIQKFAEVDKAQWFSLDAGKIKLNPAQAELIDRLADKLGLEAPLSPPEQSSLF